MKALIAAGGRATRLRPITWTRNKHLIPLANKPMLANAITKLVDAGITDIGININPGDTEIEGAFGDGSAYGAKITYLEQKGGPLGLAHIVKNAKSFLGTDSFVFYLGDNIILGSLRRFIERFEKGDIDGLLALARVSDPERFGVPVIENGRITKVIEKPKEHISDFAVTGIYLYSSKIFEAVEAIVPGPRGEYEISDAHTWMIEHGAKIGFEEITGWWKDTGTPKDLLEGNALLLNDRQTWQIQNAGTVDATAVLRGDVSVGKGSIVGKNVMIRGPVAIGEGVELQDCYIGPYTSIGNNAKIIGATVENSIVFPHVTIRDCHIVDSLLGQNATIVRAPSHPPRGHQLVVGDNASVQL
jgi:glucose-1-phosphate thymidylyltransferase